MSRIPCRARTTGTTSLVAAVIMGLATAVLGLGLGPVGAAATDARTQRAAVRASQAQVASQVNALEGTQAEISKALAALEENVRGQEAVVSDARRRAEASSAEAREAEIAAEATNKELIAIRAKLARYAVAAYLDPPGEEILRRFEAVSAQEDETRRALIEMQSGTDADVIDQLRTTKQRLEEQRKRAENAKAEAEAHVAEAEQALTALSAAKNQQATFASQVRQRLDERLSEAMYLSRLDASFGAQIAAEAAALAESVSGVPVTPGGSSGGTTPPVTTPGGSVSRPPLTTVGGITVNSRIADSLRGLLAAASSAGFRLGGYGYRDINAQIQLRRQNCGTSEYAIWQMPADSCSPPTARPGYSMHEQGLAVDFQSNGSFISSRSNPAFGWLAANAGRFGFTNLPSEPWHWSNPG
ncbi:Peptidase_M15 domain containing protein [Acidimicrobiia bacterium]